MNPLFLFKLIGPRSKNEDIKRREFILNVLLFGSIILSVVTLCITKINLIRLGAAYKGVSPEIPLIISLTFFSLYFFSRGGFFISVSYILIAICFASATYTVYAWGIDIPQGLLTYALIIVMSGVLINTKFASVVTLITAITLILFTYLQTNLITHPDLYWKREMLGVTDTVAILFTFGVIMIVSWLSNREIEKALYRARGSEKALKKERDLLEVRVEKRTQELKQVQLERMSQLYRFAEFGRMAAGLFHDLSNPLTTVSLSLEKLDVKDKSSFLKRAIEGTKRMRRFVKAAKKQIQEQETKIWFALHEEIAQAIEILGYKAKEARVRIRLVSDNQIQAYGDPVKFHQIVSNLLANAIEAYEGVRRRQNRDIFVRLKAKDGRAILRIQDFGLGISKRNIKKIFEPLFTTKGPEKGVGIGLPVVKTIVENSFAGKIGVKSKKGSGTTFTVEFPIK